MLGSLAGLVSGAVQSGADKEYADAWAAPQTAQQAAGSDVAASIANVASGGGKLKPAAPAMPGTAGASATAMPTIKPVSPQAMPKQPAAPADEYAAAWDAPVVAKPVVRQPRQSPNGPRFALQ